MDFITCLPKNRGHDAIFVVVERLSKYVVFIPTKNTATAEDTALLFFTRVASVFGLPESIVSDRDSKFTSAFWQSVCRRWGVKQKLSTAFHPQTDGQTERMNRTLEEMLRHYVNARQSNWLELLPMAQFAINTAWNQSIQASPYFLNHGRHPRTPVSLPVDDSVPTATTFTAVIQAALELAKSSLATAQNRQKVLADRHRKAVQYHVGNKVLLSSKNLKFAPRLARKLLPKWAGPFEITRVIDKASGTVAVELAPPEGWRIHNVFHVSLISPYR